MTYKTYSEQVRDHLQFLYSRGLNVAELQVDADFVRCHAIGESHGRGELTYKTTSTMMENGHLGIGTWCRSVGGVVETFQTYGLPPSSSELPIASMSPLQQAKPIDDSIHIQAAKQAYGFWIHSQLQGESNYLTRKGVGAYGIRFRSSEQYGKVAVVPMRDIDDFLWSYQLLNPDGTKRYPIGSRTKGLFHRLKELANGKPIGIAESYVTAATCMELSEIPTVCAFSSDNLPEVTRAISLLFPASPIFIFADNDRHHLLKSDYNKGLSKAKESMFGCENRAFLVVPDFGNMEASREASDWNDLVRLKGKDFARAQMQESLESVNM